MSIEANVAPASQVGLPIVLPPHLTENFEKADAQLRADYGITPGVQTLVRLWLACGTPSQIRREFEFAVLDIKKRAIQPDASGNFDEEYL